MTQGKIIAAALLDRAPGRDVVMAGALLLVSVVTLLTVATESGGHLRAAVAVLFGLTAPGWVVTRLLAPLSPALEWTLSIALSMAGLVTVGTVMLLASAWHPVLLFSLYCAVTTLALLAFLVGRFLSAPRTLRSPVTRTTGAGT